MKLLFNLMRDDGMSNIGKRYKQEVKESRMIREDTTAPSNSPRSFIREYDRTEYAQRFPGRYLFSRSDYL